MITVEILINGKPIFVRSARNISQKLSGDCIYACDDGRKIKHKRTNGAVKLAIKLLKGIKDEEL